MIDTIRSFIVHNPAMIANAVKAMTVVYFGLTALFFFAAFKSMPERMRQAEFFARKDCEAQEEWEAVNRAKQ